MQKSFFLPTYEQAVAITQGNECFYEKKTEVNGVQVSVFNYRLAQFKDFDKPIEGSDLNAYELRGLTFVHEVSGTKRYLMLHKFFNLNQVPGYQYDEVKDLEVTSVQTKLDGSMIRFLKIEDAIVAKTKMDFTNDQCVMAMACLKNQKLEKFIEKTIENGIVAIFEITSPLNQIVISYSNTEIRLLQMRDEKNGEYMDIYSNPLVVEFNVPCVTKEEVNSLDYYVAQSKMLEGTEGWIVKLNNEQMLKIKTEWYFRLHGLLSENLVRENKIMEMILTETIDDALAQISEKDPRRKYSEEIQKELLRYIEFKVKEVLDLKNKYNGSRKDFALAYKSLPLFPIVAKVLEDTEGVEERVFGLIQSMLIRNNAGLMDAKDFVKNELKVELKYLESSVDND